MEWLTQGISHKKCFPNCWRMAGALLVILSDCVLGIVVRGRTLCETCCNEYISLQSWCLQGAKIWIFKSDHKSSINLVPSSLARTKYFGSAIRGKAFWSYKTLVRYMYAMPILSQNLYLVQDTNIHVVSLFRFALRIFLLKFQFTPFAIWNFKILVWISDIGREIIHEGPGEALRSYVVSGFK